MQVVCIPNESSPNSLAIQRVAVQLQCSVALRGPRSRAAHAPKDNLLTAPEGAPLALVVFLRGVNVGGHRTVRPSMLAQQLKRYGVVNVGAAGTFVARKATSQSLLRVEFERRLPFQAEVIICRGSELLRAASVDRFGDAPIRSDLVRFVSILPRRPRRPPGTPLDLPAEGRWFLRILAREERFIFGLYRRQMQTIRHLGTMDRLFGMPVITRNWNTVAAIAKILTAAGP